MCVQVIICLDNDLKGPKYTLSVAVHQSETSSMEWSVLGKHKNEGYIGTNRDESKTRKTPPGGLQAVRPTPRWTNRQTMYRFVMLCLTVLVAKQKTHTNTPARTEGGFVCVYQHLLCSQAIE